MLMFLVYKFQMFAGGCGQAKQTLQCVDNNPAKLRFRLAGNSQTQVDVIADDKGYSQLLIKHTDASYDCPRKTAVEPS